MLEVTISLKSLFLKIRHLRKQSCLSQLANSNPHSSDRELLPRLSYISSTSVTDVLFSKVCISSSSQSLENSQLERSISKGFWSLTKEIRLSSWEKYFLLVALASFKLSVRCEKFCWIYLEITLASSSSWSFDFLYIQNFII